MKLIFLTIVTIALFPGISFAYPKEISRTGKCSAQHINWAFVEVETLSRLHGEKMDWLSEKASKIFTSLLYEDYAVVTAVKYNDQQRIKDFLISCENVTLSEEEFTNFLKQVEIYALEKSLEGEVQEPYGCTPDDFCSLNSAEIVLRHYLETYIWDLYGRQG